jgi:uncharacterized membrane protein YGL010W
MLIAQWWKWYRKLFTVYIHSNRKKIYTHSLCCPHYVISLSIIISTNSFNMYICSMFRDTITTILAGFRIMKGYIFH